MKEYRGLIYRWEYREDPYPEEESIRRALRAPAWVAHYLAQRGIASARDARRWLDPALEHLPPPDSLPDIKVASARIADAVVRGETIAVHGDYDVDGFAASHLLAGFLTGSGARVLLHVPDRLTDGYGLGVEAVRRLRERGAGLLVTVDCGIRDHAAVEEANRLGMDVVVTDHHLPGETVPPALAVVNPRLPGNGNPFRNLSGAGVAFYLAAAARARLRERGHYDRRPLPNMRSYLDFAALGALADAMPLKGVNRILVSHGLREMAQSPRPCVRALMETLGVDQPDAADVLFRFAPAINAASRLGRQDVVLDWLAAETVDKAREYAAQMRELNGARRDLEAEIVLAAEDAVEREGLLDRDRVLVVRDREWHAGVLGIVAQRLADLHHRPAIVLTRKDGGWEGSGRSVDGFDLHEALCHCADHLERFGGHAAAAGLRVNGGGVDSFRRDINAFAAGRMDGPPEPPTLEMHSRVDLNTMGTATVEWIRRLGPFGGGCPEPVFFTGPLRVVEMRELKGGHLRMRLASGRTVLSAIAFRMAPLLEGLGTVGELESCAFVPEINTWRGRSELQLRVVDMIPESNGKTHKIEGGRG